MDGFATADVEVRTENDGTALILADRGRIVLRGVTRLDDDDLAFRRRVGLQVMPEKRQSTSSFDRDQ